MVSHGKPLGTLKPLGGGDPVPLKKEVLVVGRRPTCDVQIDFENVSGKHCELRYIRGVWHVRDLSSTNGTTVNGQRVTHDHGVMPDDELGMANHFFTIDYEPIAPTSLADANAVLEEEVLGETRRVRSLMELAGLEGERSRRGRGDRPERPAANDELTEFEALPDDGRSGTAASAKAQEAPAPNMRDDDFFDLIRDDLKEPSDGPGKRRK
jgi:predicted component of type VI protein secretion system